ncbi:hypothetical protein TrST_g10364 [Triparma strigata]|uniref:Uncharacterized protein n=1 Tax=Triparma strigata TaxID=1606541 RepID=A0A9W7AX53_9STRA|nr:hypothetical protein TrST_g10364 [Triparma strigata]
MKSIENSMDMVDKRKVVNITAPQPARLLPESGNQEREAYAGEEVGPVSSQNTYMLGSQHGSGGGGAAVREGRGEGGQSQTYRTREFEDGGVDFGLGVTGADGGGDGKEEWEGTREELGFEHRVVKAGELALMKRPMSAGGIRRTIAASRTFETAESVARYLGPQSIHTSGPGKKKIVLGGGKKQRPSSAFGVGGAGAGDGEKKKERPKTAAGRLSRITAKVDSRKDAGENFNVLTEEQKAAIKLKREKKKEKRKEMERENLRKKVLNASSKGVIYRHIQGARGRTIEPEAISGTNQEGKVYYRFENGQKDKHPAKINMYSLSASGSMY